MDDRMKQQLDIQSKLWNKDISALSNQEIMDIIQNMFYQLFLVQVEDMEIGIRSNINGTSVKIVISGLCYMDEANLDISDKIEMEEEFDGEE